MLVLRCRLIELIVQEQLYCMQSTCLIRRRFYSRDITLSHASSLLDHFLESEFEGKQLMHTESRTKEIRERYYSFSDDDGNIWSSALDDDMGMNFRLMSQNSLYSTASHYFCHISEIPAKMYDVWLNKIALVYSNEPQPYIATENHLTRHVLLKRPIKHRQCIWQWTSCSCFAHIYLYATDYGLSYFQITNLTVRTRSGVKTELVDFRKSPKINSGPHFGRKIETKSIINIATNL